MFQPRLCCSSSQSIILSLPCRNFPSASDWTSRAERREEPGRRTSRTTQLHLISGGSRWFGEQQNLTPKFTLEETKPMTLLVLWVTANPRQQLIWVWRTLRRVEVTLLCHGFGFFSATVAAALKLTHGKTQRLRKCNRLITRSDKKIPLINDTGWNRMKWQRDSHFWVQVKKLTAKHLDGQKLLDPTTYPPILLLWQTIL